MFPEEKTPAPKAERQSLVLTWYGMTKLTDGYSIDQYCIVTYCNIVT